MENWREKFRKEKKKKKAKVVLHLAKRSYSKRKKKNFI